MLLHIQKPGSNYVTSVAEWQNRFDRCIKPEARPMVVLRPFGPVSFVFDLRCCFCGQFVLYYIIRTSKIMLICFINFILPDLKGAIKGIYGIQ